MPLKVLIVEDDPNFLKVVEVRLKSWLPEVTLFHAGTLADARALLDNPEHEFDLLILDQHLPDGLGSTLVIHPRIQTAAILAVSADDAPELPASALRAGAQHFLAKRQVSEPLFVPLVEALLDRRHLEAELLKARLRQSRLETIKVLLGTLRHEINNPLGAVMGGVYLLKSKGNLEAEQSDAIRLIEASGNRIKHVLNQLCQTAELEEVTKGQEQVFQVPGDPSWERNPKKTNES
ncbi:MAG: response regulator [Bdellovibrionota bacterium]